MRVKYAISRFISFPAASDLPPSHCPSAGNHNVSCRLLPQRPLTPPAAEGWRDIFSRRIGWECGRGGGQCWIGPPMSIRPPCPFISRGGTASVGRRRGRRCKSPVQRPLPYLGANPSRRIDILSSRAVSPMHLMPSSTRLPTMARRRSSGGAYAPDRCHRSLFGWRRRRRPSLRPRSRRCSAASRSSMHRVAAKIHSASKQSAAAGIRP
mmetsp:Transcript_3998/g.9387  ORF Transcript_3998/g.9387 Transcript_3998/m.9387 type:complete len:209 (+) Transcript_3998:237-863(+)